MQPTEAVEEPNALPDDVTRSTLLLLIAQILSGSFIMGMVTVTGLVSPVMAPIPWMVTLPNSLTILGVFCTVSAIGKQIETKGWKRTLGFGISIALLSIAVAITALYLESFVLYCLACFISGAFMASFRYYVLAATELTDSESKRRRAISLLTACGFISAFIGTGLVNHGEKLLDIGKYQASLVMLALVLLCSLVCLLFVNYPTPQLKPSTQSKGKGRSVGAALSDFASQLHVLKTPIGGGIFVSVMSYAFMTLLMHASPVAMYDCGLAPTDTASVLQWHFVAMYVPAAITGLFANRVRSELLAAAGIAVAVASCFWGYFSGPYYNDFNFTLILCGIAWGLMFPAGTALMLQHCRVDERIRIQGLATLLTYATNLTSSLTTGAIVSSLGWAAVSLLSLVPVAVAALALVILNGPNPKLQLAGGTR